MTDRNPGIHCVGKIEVENIGVWPGFYKRRRGFEFHFVKIQSAFFYVFRVQ